MRNVFARFFDAFARKHAGKSAADLVAQAHAAGGDAPTQAVFIDSTVPDLADLVAGVKPGERVFLIDPGHDGLAQIAADLAANHLTNLSSIAIVAHGASGTLQLGASSLDDGDLGAHKAALARIGAALGSQGKLELYACDVAAGAAGKTFIADLSHDAKGADVLASTQDIGRTPTGENWALDAASSPASVVSASPFTAAAMQSYAGTLATGPDGQLVIQTDNGLGGQYLNSNATTPTVFEPYSSNPFSSIATNIDPALGIDFEYNSTFHIENAPYAATSSQPTEQGDFKNYFNNAKQADGNTLAQDVANLQTDVKGSPAIDLSNHVIYLPIQSGITSENGFLSIDYTETYVNGVQTVGLSKFHHLETTTGNAAPSFQTAAQYYNGNLYFLDYNQGEGGSNAENGIYRISTTGTNHAPVLIANPSEYGGTASFLTFSALDKPDNRLFFNTLNYNASTEAVTNPQIYVLSNANTAASGDTNVTQLTFASNLAAPPFQYIGALTYDANSSTLYVGNTIQTASKASSTGFDDSASRIYALHLNAAGTQVMSYDTINDVNPNETNAPPVQSLGFVALPTLAVAGTATAVSKTTPVTLLAAAPTITSIDSGGYLASATVKITDATTGSVVSGDTLGLAKNGTFNAFTSTAAAYVDNGHTFNVSYAGGVLTIANQPGSAGENTIAAYQQVLQDVQYKNNSTNTDNRAATFQVNNGAIVNPSGSINTQSFNVVVAKPPTIVAGGYTLKDLAGATVTADAPGALTGDIDPNGGTLTITAVATSGGTAGTVGQALAGTYGSLTLNANGAYSYTAGSAAGAPIGSHPMDGYSFTVTNAGGSATEGFAVTLDRAPTGTGINVTATEAKTTTGAAGAAFANDTDADGDALAVASVSYTNPTTNMTTTGTVGQAVTGQFGTLTLNANGSYSYNANNAANYTTANATGQPTVDNFTYTASYGMGGATAPETLHVNVTCFASGSLIRIARPGTIGDVAVEDLRVGDLAVTASGDQRPIRWLGSRTYDCRQSPGPRSAWPVRVAAHAFGANRPSRDLYLSPGHSVCVGVIAEVLIPIQELVNGFSIAYAPTDQVTYWHVELDSHDILLANDLPAESFLEMGANRALLSDAVDADLPIEVRDRTHADFCRRFVDGGPLLAVVREQLARRAAALGWTAPVSVEPGLRIAA